MEVTITHRCGTRRTFWAMNTGGYVYLTSPDRPGCLGEQPTMRGGWTIACGLTTESLRWAAWRWIRQRAREEGMCACGADYRGHDSGAEGVRS
jgi:hypothetical protein